jgi:hypothetical protein
MMDLLTRDDFDHLLTASGEPKVSLYLPTHRPGDPQDRVRFKNLVADAERALVGNGTRSPEAHRILAPADGLLDDTTFWSHQEDGLAVFASENSFQSFRLPVSFGEQSVVADHFYLAPLAPMVGTDAEFHLLALSQNAVRLLHGTRFSVSEIELRDIPTSLVEALWYQDRERQLQFHQTGRTGRTGLAAVFHGQGMGSDTADEEIVQFFRAVDAGILHIVDTHIPMVLAGVSYLFPLYRKASQHPSIVEGGVEGNPERLSPAELHQLALPVVEHLLDQDRAVAEARISAGSSPVASTLEEVAVAARQARVDTVFLENGARRWGRFADEGTTVQAADQPGADSVDLVDDIARHTWSNGGRVYLTDDVPGAGSAAALLRF